MKLALSNSRFQDPKSLPTLVIGTDFGTTFSGVAWALSTEPEKTHIIRGWPGSGVGMNTDSPKVPTSIAYHGAGIESTWGFDEDSEGHELTWFKLLLCKEAERRASSQQSIFTKLRSAIKSMDKQPEDVVSDYLHCLWKHSFNEIGNALGAGNVKKLKIKLVITVPAIWDHVAKDLTRKAAYQAKCLAGREYTVTLIAEPEAAALTVFRDLGNQRLERLEIGDCFVICDAGGGTVDLISYRVKGNSPLELSMCTESTGGLYGAVFLDIAFKKKLEELGDFEALSSRKQKKAMKDWEHQIKRPFSPGAKMKRWCIDIAGLIKYNAAKFWKRVKPGNSGQQEGDEDDISFTNEDVENIFNTVCPQIADLVAEQVARAKGKASRNPKAIFLVGGFGASQFLRQTIQNRSNIEVRSPQNSWTAICEGAVLKGLASQDTITNHISNENHGVSFTSRFDLTKHLEKDKYWDHLQLHWRADNQMKWYIKRGQNILKAEPVEHYFSQSLESPRKLVGLTQSFYSSKREGPEDRITDDVEKLCTLSVDLDPGIWDDLEVCRNVYGTEYREIHYSIVMELSAGEIIWRVIYNGEEKGQARVDYQGGYSVVDRV